MKLNEKQFAALDALLDERAMSAEAMRASMLVSLRDAHVHWFAFGSVGRPNLEPVGVITFEPPTLAEINARVMRDSVVWQVTGSDLSKFGAVVGSWILTAEATQYPRKDWRWTLHVGGSYGRGPAASGTADSEKQCKSLCIAMLQELVTL